MSKESMGLLEQKCSKMILDCVDWRKIDSKNDKETVQNVGNTYDLLYQVYCAKLTEQGSDYSSEQALRRFIKESKEKRMSETMSFKSKSKSKSKPWFADDGQLFWWIAAGFVSIIVILYYVVLYFTVFDTSLEEENRLHR